jgi:hypothetical protein
MQDSGSRFHDIERRRMWSALSWQTRSIRGFTLETALLYISFCLPLIRASVKFGCERRRFTRAFFKGNRLMVAHGQWAPAIGYGSAALTISSGLLEGRRKSWTASLRYGHGRPPSSDSTRSAISLTEILGPPTQFAEILGYCHAQSISNGGFTGNSKMKLNLVPLSGSTATARNSRPHTTCELIRWYGFPLSKCFFHGPSVPGKVTHGRSGCKLASSWIVCSISRWTEVGWPILN